MIQFNGLPGDVHTCTGERQGEWMIWRCRLCPGYERRLNWVTGAMVAHRAGSTARHTGETNPGDEREAFRQTLPLN